MSSRCGNPPGGEAETWPETRAGKYVTHLKFRKSRRGQDCLRHYVARNGDTARKNARATTAGMNVFVARFSALFGSAGDRSFTVAALNYDRSS